MKTTIDIPDEAMKQLLEHTGARTKREAVVQAIESFNKRCRMARLTEILGTFDQFMTQEDLRRMRQDERWNRAS